MICSSCGYKSIVFDFIKCPRCGLDYIKSLKTAQSQQSESVYGDHAEKSSETSQETHVKFCTSCGKDVNVGARYCAYCGTQIVQTVKEKAIIPTQPVQSPSVEPVALADMSVSVSADLHQRIQKRGIRPKENSSRPDDFKPSVGQISVDPKQMSRVAFIGFCFLSWVVGAFIANSISILLGGAYAEATIAVVIGFWAGKAAAKYKKRDWKGVVAFPIITLISGLLGISFGLALASQNPGSPDWTALIVATIAFVLSFALFFALVKFTQAKNG